MKTIGNKASVMSALESALAAIPDKQIREDEFTRDQWIAKMRENGDKRSFDGLRNALLALVKQGIFKSRKVCIDGKECNAYSKV
jgi:uncharacterized protein HemY